MYGMRYFLFTLVIALVTQGGDNKSISKRFFFDTMANMFFGGMSTAFKGECVMCKCANWCFGEVIIPGGNQTSLCGKELWASINCHDVHNQHSAATTQHTLSQSHPTASTSGTTNGHSAHPATTMPPAPTIDPVQATFCINKNIVTCGTNVDPVCGSDKVFYLNKCEFTKAMCADLSLQQKEMNFCTS